MKIAICISGGFRNCKALHANFRKYLLESDLYEADVFFFSWNSKIDHFKVNIKDEATIQEVVDLYKPKKYLYEVYDQETRERLYRRFGMDEFQKWARENKTIARTHGRWAKHSLCKVCNQMGFMGGKCRICGGENVHNHIGMLYGIREADKLRIEQERITVQQYDLVIRTRFDNIYYEKLSETILSSAKDSWVIPEGDDDLPDYGSGCNDQFCITSSHLMCYYSFIVNWMDGFARKNYNSYGGYGIPHMSIDNMAKYCGVPIKKVPFKYAINKRVEERGWKVPV